MPEQHQRKFRRVDDKLIVKWFGEDTFSALKINYFLLLGQNLQDAKLAAQFEDIVVKYNMALSKLLRF